MDDRLHTTIPISSVTKNIVMDVKVTGEPVWHLRLRIAIVLMRIAARVAGVGLRVDTGVKGHRGEW